MICPRCGYESAYSMENCPRCGIPWRAGPVRATAPAGARMSADPRTSAGAWSPADSRTPWTPDGDARQGVSREFARTSASSFDPARLTTSDRITGVATLVLFISLFLPWFKASSSFGSGAVTLSLTVDALTGHRYLYLVLIVALLTIGYLVVHAGREAGLGLPVSHERLLSAASGINLLVVLIAVIFKPPGTSMVTVSWSLGAYVGVIAAIVAVAPSVRSWLRARQPRLSR